MDRSPPYSEESERGLLGSVLLDYSRVLDLCTEKGLVAEALYVPSHRTIFGACLDLYEAKQPVDLLSVTGCIKDQGALDRIGGSVFLDRLVDSTPTAAHSEYYIEHVMEKWLARKVIEEARETESVLYAGGSPIEVIATHLHNMTELQGHGDKRTSKGDVWARCQANAAAAKEGKTVGLPSPWEGFNRETGGATHAGVTLILGGGGTRKSFLANQWGLHASVNKGEAGVYYPFEDGPVRATDRSVSLLAGLNCYHWSRGRYTPEQARLMVEAFKVYDKSPMEIRGGRGKSLAQRRLEIARGVAKSGWKYVIFDAFKDMMKNSDDISEQSTTIKWCADVAEEFDIPVLLTHHVNRGNKDVKQQAERIMKKDMRGSLTIWDASRMVIALQCQKKLTLDNRPRYVHYVLDCIKNNYGPLGSMALNINQDTGRFTESARAPFSEWTEDEYETVRKEGHEAF